MEQLSKEKRRERRKSLKKTSPALALYTHPAAPPVIICGKKVTFSGPLLLYVTAAFIAGFLDAFFFASFEVFVTMSTGNLVQGCLNGYAGNIPQSIFAFGMALSTAFVGGLLSCVVMEQYPNKVVSFTVLSGISIFACAATALSLGSSINEDNLRQGYFAALMVAASSGAMSQWVMKLGYTYPLYTVNILKVAESVYKAMRNISQGGAKLRGDLLTVGIMFFSFLLGCFFGKAAEINLNHDALFVVCGIHVVQVIHFTTVSPLSPFPCAWKPTPPPTSSEPQGPRKTTTGTAPATILDVETAAATAATDRSVHDSEDFDVMDPNSMSFACFMPSEVHRYAKEHGIMNPMMTRITEGSDSQSREVSTDTTNNFRGISGDFEMHEAPQNT